MCSYWNSSRDPGRGLTRLVRTGVAIGSIGAVVGRPAVKANRTDWRGAANEPRRSTPDPRSPMTHPRFTNALTKQEWLRLSGFGGAVAGLHLAGWGLFIYYPGRCPAVAG